ncbi:MAG: hypothetical protein WBQ94_22575 [Terracidiphilus sp.]
MESAPQVVWERGEELWREPLSLGHLLVRSFRLCRANFFAFAAASMVPAIGRLCWNLVRSTIAIHRHPEWPQGGVTVNSDWGLNIYSTNLALTIVGLLLFYILGGIALSSTAGVVSAMSPSEAVGMKPAYARTRAHWFRCLKVQLVATIYVWGAFLAGSLSAFVFGATALASNQVGDAGLAIWYALIAFALFVGVPVGIVMHMRYAMAVPVSVMERLAVDPSLRRCAQLSRGTGMRLLELLAVTGGLRFVLGVVSGWSLHLLTGTHPLIAVLSFVVIPSIASFLLDALLFPFYCIGITLLYFNAHEKVAEGSAI